MARQVVDHNLTSSGVGRCKVANFGVTGGTLPFGYMTDDTSGSPQVDWRSSLPFYYVGSDRVYPSWNLSAPVAETRCKQVVRASEIVSVLLS